MKKTRPQPLYSVKIQRGEKSWSGSFPIDRWSVIACLMRHFEEDEQLEPGFTIEIKRVS